MAAIDVFAQVLELHRSDYISFLMMNAVHEQPKQFSDEQKKIYRRLCREQGLSPGKRRDRPARARKKINETRV